MERSILEMNYSHSPKIFLKKVEETGREYYFFTTHPSKEAGYIGETWEAWDTDQERSDDDLKSCGIIKYLKEHYDGKSIYVLGPRIPDPGISIF